MQHLVVGAGVVAESDVVVVGGGLLGLASAWALAEQGFQVELLERGPAVGLETSYANAGMVTPSMADPWNSPGLIWQLLKWGGQAVSPLQIKPAALWRYLGWGWQFLAHSSPAHHQRATAANFDLAVFSLQQFHAIRQSLKLNYALRTQGTLQLFRQARSLASATAHAQRLAPVGLRAEVLDQNGLLALEPAIADCVEQLVGGIHYPDDETGDAQAFCRELYQALLARGVKFRFDLTVQGLRCEAGQLRALQTSEGEMPVTQVVLAAAAQTPALLAGTGIRLPVRPVKGYSLTVPTPAGVTLPARSLIDSDRHAAITPLDDRLRLAGTAEIAGWNRDLPTARLDVLWQLLRDNLPQAEAACDRAQATAWCGFRPMSADGMPSIGPTRLRGLALNVGHGHLGWTQCLGSGLLLAQLLGGQQAGIDAAPFSPQRH